MIGTFFTNVMVAILASLLLIMLLVAVQSPLLEPCAVMGRSTLSRIMLPPSADAKTDRVFQVFVMSSVVFFVVAYLAGE